MSHLPNIGNQAYFEGDIGRDLFTKQRLLMTVDLNKKVVQCLKGKLFVSLIIVLEICLDFEVF